MGTKKLWILKVEIPWYEYKTTADFIFESSEDAFWYAEVYYLQRYFGGDKEFMLKNIDVEPISILERKSFTKLNPYIAVFENKELQNICSWAECGMFDSSFYIQEFNHFAGVQHTVKFWFSGDVEVAKEVAEGYLEGYLLAKAKNT